MERSNSETKRREWAKRLEVQAASGLSVAAYCRRELISEASFYYWKRTLRDSRHTTHTARRGQHSHTAHPKQSRDESASRQPLFVQLAAATHAPPVSLNGSAHVEVVTPQGATIRVPTDQIDVVVAVTRLFAVSDPADATGKEARHA